MLIPLHDGLPLRRIPFQLVTTALIVLCVLVQLYSASLGEEEGLRFAYAFGAIPVVIMGQAELPLELTVIPTIWTPFTSVFLHADWWHLIGNMVFLWVLGDNVEDAFGHWRFLAFYLICGVVAAFAHAASIPGGEGPLIGASGAVSGVVAAYLLMHPKQKIWALLFGKIPVRFRAYWLLGAWIAMQVFFAFVGDGSNTAWFAHLGGLVAGALLTPVFRRRDMPLFDQANVAPPAPEVLAAIRQRYRIPRAGGSPWTRRRPD